MSGAGGMLPEQVWDAAPLADRRLLPGRPSGSAMPLAWAHAEFIKLFVSWQQGRPLDLPAAVWQRYQGRRPRARHAFWLPQAPLSRVMASTDLYVAMQEPCVVHWGVDNWQMIQDVATEDIGLGLHVALLATRESAPRSADSLHLAECGVRPMVRAGFAGDGRRRAGHRRVGRADPWRIARYPGKMT